MVILHSVKLSGTTGLGNEFNPNVFNDTRGQQDFHLLIVIFPATLQYDVVRCGICVAITYQDDLSEESPVSGTGAWGGTSCHVW